MYSVKKEMGILSNWLRKQRTKRVKPFIKGSVLDIGCGPAEILKEIHPKKYVGIEGNQEQIQKLKEQYPQYKFQTLDLDEEELIFEEKFETIILLAVIEHIYNQKHIFQQLVKNLKPGGKIVLTTPTPFGNDIVHRIGSRIGLFSKTMHDDHIVIYNKARFKIVAKDFNLKMEHYKRFQLGCNQIVVFKKPPTPSSSSDTTNPPSTAAASPSNPQ